VVLKTTTKICLPASLCVSTFSVLFSFCFVCFYPCTGTGGADVGRASARVADRRVHAVDPVVEAFAAGDLDVRARCFFKKNYQAERRNKKN